MAGGPYLSAEQFRSRIGLDHVTPEPVRSLFIPFTDPLEGSERCMYTDITGLVTTARGKLIDFGLRRKTPTDDLGPTGPAPAATLPWKFASGAPATVTAVSQEWWRMKHFWPKTQSDACRRIATVFLDQVDVDRLTLEQLDGMWDQALKYFPGLAADPPPAQLGVLSMSWAMGGAFESGYPHFDAAVLAKDWTTAAAECLMNKYPVPTARNRKNQALFLAAAAGAPLTV